VTRADSPLQRQTTWAGLRRGDAVVVNLERERRGRFTFVAFVTNRETGDAWVEVRGGRDGELKDRSFRPDAIFPAHARKGAKITGASLTDAPQLPLA
jgi:hypothetical protein